MQKSELPNDPAGYIVMPRRLGLGIMWTLFILVAGGAITWTKTQGETQAQIDAMAQVLNATREDFDADISGFVDRQSSLEERMSVNRERLASLEANVEVVVRITQNIDAKMDRQTEYTRAILQEMRGEMREDRARPRPGTAYVPFGRIPALQLPD